jgi:hypothetical protein
MVNGSPISPLDGAELSNQAPRQLRRRVWRLEDEAVCLARSGIRP